MCYNPLFVKRGEKFDPDTGEYKTVLKFVKFYMDYDFTLPCCKCAECLYQKSLEWSYRIMLEAKEYKRSCFVTLTYKDNPVSLNKRDYQLFMKRFRKKLGSTRYFVCGEYGSKGKRPHYHIILFGYWPSDAELVYNKKGELTPYYSSKELEDLWGLGFVTVGELTQYDARYCAKYMQKLQSMPPEFVQPFVSMSLKPGIGYKYYEDHKEALLRSDKIYFHGDYIKLPKYFLSKALNGTPEYLDDYLRLKDYRAIKASLVPNTPENMRERKKKYEKLLT